MKIVFVLKTGEKVTIDNVVEDFRKVANASVDSKWVVTNDIAINMNEISHFYSVKEEIK